MTPVCLGASCRPRRLWRRSPHRKHQRFTGLRLFLQTPHLSIYWPLLSSGVRSLPPSLGHHHLLSITYICALLYSFYCDPFCQDWREKIWPEKEKKWMRAWKSVNKGAHEITGVLQHGVINILDPRISCPLALSVEAEHMLQSYASVFPTTLKQTGDKHQALQSQVLLRWSPLCMLHKSENFDLFVLKIWE